MIVLSGPSTSVEEALEQVDLGAKHVRFRFGDHLKVYVERYDVDDLLELEFLARDPEFGFNVKKVVK